MSIRNGCRKAQATVSTAILKQVVQDCIRKLPHMSQQACVPMASTLTSLSHLTWKSKPSKLLPHVAPVSHSVSSQ